MTFDVLALTSQKRLRQTYESELRKHDFEVCWVESASEAIVTLQHLMFDIAMVDFDSAGFDGQNACRQLLDANQILPLIGLASGAVMESAIKLLDTDLSDLAILPADSRILAFRIRRAISCAMLSRDIRELARTTNDILPAARQHAKAEDLHVPPFIVRFQTNDEFTSMEEIERKYTRYVLDCVGGNRSHAARILGVSRKTLWRKLRENE